MKVLEYFRATLKTKTNRNTVSAAVACLLAAVLLSVVSGRLYADTGTWTDGDAPVLNVRQQIPNITAHSDCFPTIYTYFSHTYNNSGTVTYDPIGHDVTTNVCATQNGLGFYGNSDTDGSRDNYEFIRPNTSTAFRVLTPNGGQGSVTPVPNQATFFVKDTSLSYSYGQITLNFYDNFPSAGSFGLYWYGSNYASQELAFKLQSSGASLKDSAGRTIYMHAYAFSPNGQWMVMEAVGLGLVRVNTQTRAMQLFDQIQPAYYVFAGRAMTLAISDDGNSVIKSGKYVGDTMTYDLSGCQAVSFAAGADNSTAMQGCRSRDVQDSLRAQLSGFDSLSQMQFSADGKSVSAAATRYGALGTPDYFSVTYSVAGYQPPHLGYLALGDSFSSGEGVGNYEVGTDTSENTCHLSKQSYPYLAARVLALGDFHSVACSGAETKDYRSGQQGQHRILGSSLGDWTPGYQGQGKYFGNAGNTSIVTISMIGNDIDFAGKLTTCLTGPDPCYHFREDRQNIAEEIYGKFDTLVSLYTSIKKDSGNKDNVKVYVLGYPQIFGTGPSSTCGSNVRFDQEERQMAGGLAGYLDAVIKAAAEKAGVQYVDTEHAFDGHRLCESGDKAVNGLTAGNDTPIDGIGPIDNGSYHPNALGHQFLSQALLAQSQDFTKLMPTANPDQQAPYIGSPEYNAFIGDAPSGGTLSHLVYGGLVNTEIILKKTGVQIDPTDLVMMPSHQVELWLNSTPTYLGTLTADSLGKVSGEVTIPDSVEPGYHTLHLYGKNLGGEDVNVYQTVYVAASADDYDGDGVPNSQDPCLIIPPSGVDSDRDGIDDACDGEISAAPADTVPPAVTGTADRQPDHNGWYGHDTVITWTAADPAPSSGAPSQPAPTIADQEGDRTYASGQSCDPAGNCAAGSIRIKLDKTAPNIAFTVSPVPNIAGWNKGAVTVNFTCNDATSGVESCTDPVTVAAADGVYVVTGTAVDNAGNVSSVNAIVPIDGTAPLVANTATPAANTNGWNNSDVTVTPSCSDNLSGIASCSQPVTLTDEGANQIVVGSAEDNADNSASAVMAVHIDKTAPVISGFQWTGNPKATTGPVTLSVQTSDNLSGVVRAEYFLGDTDPGFGNGAAMQASGSDFAATFGTDFPTGVYKVNVRVRDAAGNWSTDADDYLVVYNPFSMRMTGKKFVQPLLTHGDYLPGLIDAGQADTAKFGFSVGYDSRGNMLPNNDFQFSYNTGTNCTKPGLARNCHSFSLNSTSVAWLSIYGANNSYGTFEGSAVLTVDGTRQSVIFLLTGLDGERLDSTSADHLMLRVFALSANPSNATPLFQIDDDVVRGNIHIKT